MSHADTNSQPAPKPNDKPAVWSMVMQDMLDRDRFGLEKYGIRLQPFNGRDALVDAYQEALDLVVYLRTAIYERDNPAAMPAKFGQQNQLDTGVMRFPKAVDWHMHVYGGYMLPDNYKEVALEAMMSSKGKLIIDEFGLIDSFKSGGFTGKGCLSSSPTGGPMLRCPDCIAEHCACIAS